MKPLLEIEGLETSYGSSQVLFGIDLAIGPGEVVTLLGRNGMGKTTTVRSIMGLCQPGKGSVRLRGEPITNGQPGRIARLGIGLVPEGRQIFPNLTVKENLVAFAANRAGRDNPWTLERVFALFPRLAERKGNMGNQLSGGEQQMLAIARALMTNSELLIIDEATEGLAPLIRIEIWNCLKAVKAMGQSILVIDKYIQALMEFADRHYLIERGRIVWNGPTAELETQPELWEKYLGV
jgi:branched-chain amino acid transport system ATP-binding protein